MLENIVRASLGLPFAFIATLLLLIFKPFSNKLLGRDRGKVFVEGSEVNKGKFTGVGIYFITVYAVAVVCFCYSSFSLFFMMLLMMASSIFGFMDDRSINPWGEYLKGALDFGVSIIAAILYVVIFGNKLVSPFGNEFYIPSIIYVVLAIVLFIVTINATNATDGVDGLCGTLSILTVISLEIAAAIRGTLGFNGFLVGALFIAILIPYLFFNFYPSKMLMGDAGSRGIGFFIAFYAMYLKIPFAYLIVGLPFLLDGGLSILKITIGRISDKVFHKKIIILKNLRTPIHDHLKKEKGLSVPKTYTAIVIAGFVIDLIYLAVLALLKILG